MRTSLAIGLVLVLCLSAQAQLIVGNDQSSASNTLWNVDPNGVNPPVPLLTGADAVLWGLTYDNDNGVLFWNNGSTLRSAAYTGGPLTPTTLGGMTYNGSSINFVSLAYEGGKLYGTRNITTEAVYAIDPLTLEAQLVYQYPSAYDFGGLEIDPITGKMYGLTDSAPAGGVRGLYEIDLTNQTLTYKAPYPAGDTDIDGLAVYNGLAYYVNDASSQPFYIYDIASGNQLGTIATPFTGSGIFSGGAYIPEPTSLLLLAVGLLLARRGR